MALLAVCSLIFAFRLGKSLAGVTEVPVTIVVTDTVQEILVTELPVTRIVVETTEIPVEVTRVVIETTEIPVEVTRVITETTEIPMEVTRVITETTEIPVEVTRIVVETIPLEVTRIVEVPPEVIVTPGVGRGCTRFNLEIGRDKERGTPGDGTYIMQEVTGQLIATWLAKDGWLDSGWLRNVPLSRSPVHILVFFYPAVGGGPIQLEILNPAPGLSYGWLANDLCHAIEIQFPE
jgi:hypothetical protein